MINVAEYWITEFGIDGYRIDHALGPSESFFAAMSERINEIAPEAWLFGEVTSMPSFNRRYGGLLDGVTDFAFAYGLREYLAGTITVEGLASLEREAIATHPADEFSWVRFFDNHDMERGLTRWNDDPATLEQAMGALMALPGVPTIFYGTEQALTSSMRESTGGLEVGRIPMTFDAKNPMYEVVRDAIAQRLARPVDQSEPVWWKPDGAWTWGGLSGRLGENPESGIKSQESRV
jgi:glycosidase